MRRRRRKHARRRQRLLRLQKMQVNSAPQSWRGNDSKKSRTRKQKSKSVWSSVRLSARSMLILALMIGLLMIGSLTACTTSEPEPTAVLKAYQLSNPCKGLPPAIPRERTLPETPIETWADVLTVLTEAWSVAGHNGAHLRQWHEWAEANCTGMET